MEIFRKISSENKLFIDSINGMGGILAEMCTVREGKPPEWDFVPPPGDETFRVFREKYKKITFPIIAFVPTNFTKIKDGYSYSLLKTGFAGARTSDDQAGEIHNLVPFKVDFDLCYYTQSHEELFQLVNRMAVRERDIQFQVGNDTTRFNIKIVLGDTVQPAPHEQTDIGAYYKLVLPFELFTYVGEVQVRTIPKEINVQTEAVSVFGVTPQDIEQTKIMLRKLNLLP